MLLGGFRGGRGGRGGGSETRSHAARRSLPPTSRRALRLEAADGHVLTDSPPECLAGRGVTAECQTPRGGGSVKSPLRRVSSPEATFFCKNKKPQTSMSGSMFREPQMRNQSDWSPAHPASASRSRTCGVAESVAVPSVASQRALMPLRSPCLSSPPFQTHGRSK